MKLLRGWGRKESNLRHAFIIEVTLLCAAYQARGERLELSYPGSEPGASTFSPTPN